MNKGIFAALFAVVAIVWTGLALADVQECKVDAKGNLIACVSKPIASVPGEARPVVHSHAPNGVTVRPSK